MRLPIGPTCWFVSQVYAKFLGLLTFRPNWGVPATDAASTTYEPRLPSAKEKVRHNGRTLGVVCEVLFISRVYEPRI